jgi:glycosyltransferase involved in cell wall biosynthesis
LGRCYPIFGKKHKKSDRMQAVSLSILHLMRPAQGGMRAQVQSLLTNNSLLAAPPEVLAALADSPMRAIYPLPILDTPRLQLRYGYNVGRWAKAQGVDILHGHGLARAMLYVVASKVSKIPLVMTLHNLLTPEHWSHKEKLLVRWALSQCRGIICVSKAVADSARGFVSPQKLRVIYNGVSLSTLLPLRAGTHLVGVGFACKAGWRAGDWNRAPRLLLCVARLSPEKGITTIIEAMRHLPEGITLNIAGEGPERESLTRQINYYNLQERVTLLGEVSKPEIEKLLTEADIFCQPSLQEGLGIAALEAMAAGLPVVASRVGGLVEVVIESETGLLVTAGDAAGFARAIATLLENPAEASQMGGAGRVRVEQQFTREAMLAQTEQFYREILEGRVTA